ncbi:heavy-metal-associated domain-containing protein [Xanthomarina sp.]|uniref:heavy-metal-associated domain-containing protein n=1 Tax=Xanthomarina sp. TaxID=1931211 RepID=UPI002B97227B|nr:heavy-metal-associated domain-containing protein [Xanthomarina sp.]HLV38295.1 heavy-metal-associated domain-containing protein [Xanthomarina sp.]
MKKLGILLVMLIGMTAFSQDKNARATMEVDGVCNMCKERIEKACIQTKGVKSAVWNVNTHELSLIYDARKTDLATIETNIAAVGHDTKNVVATEDAYNSLHNCCLYRDEKVVDDHKDD